MLQQILTSKFIREQEGIFMYKEDKNLRVKVGWPRKLKIQSDSIQGLCCTTSSGCRLF